MILFGAGHVLGEKVYKGYSEDKNMFDLAERKAKYAAERYGQQTKTFYVTGTSYPAVEAACKGCEIASWEHSDAWTPDPTIDRVSVYRTVKNKGNGPCLLLGQATVKVLGVSYAEVKRNANSAGNDGFGCIGRAVRAGCEDSWLHEHSFHTNDRVRGLLSDSAVRQRLAEAEVDVLAAYYGWEDIMFAQRGQGTLSRPDAAVMALQNAFVKLGIPMKNDAGKVFTKADGSYGGATANGVKEFEKKYGLAKTDGNNFTDRHLTVLISHLTVQTGSDCSALEVEVAGLSAELKTAQGRLSGVKAAIDTLLSL